MTSVSRSLLRPGLVVTALLIIGLAARRQQTRQQVAVGAIEIEGGDRRIARIRVCEKDDASGAVGAEQHLKSGREERFIAATHFVTPCRIVPVPNAPAEWFGAYTSPRRIGADHA